MQKRLSVKPYYGVDGTTVVTTYKVVDDNGVVMFVGYREECLNYVKEN